MTNQTHRDVVAKLAKAHDAKSKDSFPRQVIWRGKKFEQTGKRGKDNKTGEDSMEYREVAPDNRVWVTESGKISED